LELLFWCSFFNSDAASLVAASIRIVKDLASELVLPFGRPITFPVGALFFSTKSDMETSVVKAKELESVGEMEQLLEVSPHEFSCWVSEAWCRHRDAFLA
jgi:hypothetical protein